MGPAVTNCCTEGGPSFTGLLISPPLLASAPPTWPKGWPPPAQGERVQARKLGPLSLQVPPQLHRAALGAWWCPRAGLGLAQCWDFSLALLDVSWPPRPPVPALGHALRPQRSGRAWWQHLQAVPMLWHAPAPGFGLDLDPLCLRPGSICVVSRPVSLRHTPGHRVQKTLGQKSEVLRPLFLDVLRPPEAARGPI